MKKVYDMAGFCNHMRCNLVLAVSLSCACPFAGCAQDSGLNPESFSRHWIVESESPDYSVSFIGDTCEIMAPKGLTLWRREKIEGDVTIEYDACVVCNGKSDERLSDLNCFWMASDPMYPDNIFERAGWRQGIFNRCYTLSLYYMGFGGNYNTTTRFRRYDGNAEGVENAEKRPPVLKEYLDKKHLLEANKWYHIKLQNKDGNVRYYIDGEMLVDFDDPSPLTSGWFGFRTTLSKTRIANFRYVYE